MSVLVGGGRVHVNFLMNSKPHQFDLPIMYMTHLYYCLCGVVACLFLISLLRIHQIYFLKATKLALNCQEKSDCNGGCPGKSRDQTVSSLAGARVKSNTFEMTRQFTAPEVCMYKDKEIY